MYYKYTKSCYTSRYSKVGDTGIIIQYHIRNEHIFYKKGLRVVWSILDVCVCCVVASPRFGYVPLDFGTSGGLTGFRATGGLRNRKRLK